MKLLLDTDIGSDIDDAVCLAYLLSQPQCELLGITTVSGQPDLRARIASALCMAAGRDVPIYPGAADPLIVPARQPLSPQAEKLGAWPHRTEFPQGEAIEFMRRTIRANPGEVTLFAIGPLTNIALLFKADPEIPALLKQFVIMGGDFRMPPPPNWQGGRYEWNIFCDPEAARMVYTSGASVRAIGLEITTQVWLDAAAVTERFGRHRLLRPVLDFAEVWFRQVPDRIIFHDPLAAVTLFDAQQCAFERGDVHVELASGEDHARTFWTPKPDGRHEAATSVDAERFFDAYFSVFKE